MSESSQTAPRPAAAEVARRFVILHHVAAYALATPPRALVSHWQKQWDAAEREKFQHAGVARRDSFWARSRPARSGALPLPGSAHSPTQRSST